MLLTQRETNVLAAIVEIYEDTAQPVGSQAIATKRPLGLSPATIRQCMAQLTRKGYLYQPHTSAGRVPTSQAFQYYLDQVLQFYPLTRREQSQLQTEIQPEAGDLDQVLRRTVKTLSSLTRQVCVVMAPRQDLARWRQIDFVLLRPGMIMAILVLQGGLVSHRLLHTNQELTADDLQVYSNYLNTLFAGRTTLEVRTEIMGQLEDAQKTLQAYYRAWELVAKTMADHEQPEIFVGGTNHLAAQPEFTEQDAIQELLLFIEERSHLLELLDKTQSGQSVSISLGQDVPGLPDCSLITSVYGPLAVPNSAQGTVAILGPVRMNYARIVPMVDFAAQILSQCLKSRY